MRGVILVEGDCGDDILSAARSHPAVLKAFRTMGKYAAVMIFDGDMDALRYLIGEINRMDCVWDGQTILELEFGMRQPPVQAEGHFRALLLFTEHGGKDLDLEQSFEEHAKTVPGVVEAFSLLGIHDDVALVKFNDVQDLQALVKQLESQSIRLVDIILEQS